MEIVHGYTRATRWQTSGDTNDPFQMSPRRCPYIKHSFEINGRQASSRTSPFVTRVRYPTTLSKDLFLTPNSLYYSLDYSDLVIFSRDGTRHPVHRAVVCPRSNYLATAVKEGQWRVSGRTYELVLILVAEYLTGRQRRPLVASRR